MTNDWHDSAPPWHDRPTTMDSGSGLRQQSDGLAFTGLLGYVLAQDKESRMEPRVLEFWVGTRDGHLIGRARFMFGDTDVIAPFGGAATWKEDFKNLIKVMGDKNLLTQEQRDQVFRFALYSERPPAPAAAPEQTAAQSGQGLQG